MSPFKLPLRVGAYDFGVKRFDRDGIRPLHMHTMSEFLHADHRMSSLTYETILKATLLLTKDIRECEKQFRVAAFNVFTHNRDDHAKNFSFLMNEKGVWRVSPAYDLTFSSGPSGEHCSMIMGEGRSPNSTHLMKLAKLIGIKESKAIQIIDDVRAAALNWRSLAMNAGVSSSSCLLIERALSKKLS